MTTFPGRIEGRLKIPTGGASVSASLGSLANPVTVTVPAGQYYLTAAGGVNGLLTTLQTQLNDNVQGYPTTASAMASAVGWGTWSAGWLFNIPSGNDTGAFGGVTMTASGTPTYGTAGPRGGIDKAIGFDSAGDLFSGGDVYDAIATDDLAIAWVGYVTANPAGSRGWFSKGVAPGWYVFRNTSGAISFVLNDLAVATTSTAVSRGEWHAGIAVLERGTNRMRVGAIGLTSGTVSISTETDTSAQGTLANASSLIVGDGSVTVDTDLKVSAFYIGAGSGVSSGFSANLSTALVNLRAAINASWSCSLSTTTGQITVANSFWPASVNWTTSSLGTLLGYEYAFDYPQTAAQVTAALGGYGNFASGAGYLCNEASGNLASVFGTPATLTAGGTPTYSNQGARGGIDKAVGFDSSTDQFDGGDVFDVTGTDDLCVVWVGRWSALPTSVEMLFVKGITGSARWTIYENSGAGLIFQAVSASGNIAVSQSIVSVVGEWHIGIAVVDRAAGKLRIGVRGLTSGTSLVSSEGTPYAETMNNADAFTFGNRNASLPALKWQCAAFYVVAGPSVATGLSANLSTALSSFATYMKGQTGTQHARGLWLPDSPLDAEQHPSMAPEETDLRTSESPTGIVLGLSGNRRYAHTNVRWQRVPVDAIREAAAPVDNGSFEVFFRDCISGIGGHPYFSPASSMQIWWNNAGTLSLLGGDANAGAGVAGWRLANVARFADVVKLSQQGWAGQFDVLFPRLVSDG